MYLKNGIDRIEVLKGTQSSLYGSNWIEVINIRIKKERKENIITFIIGGSNNKKSIPYSIDGADEKLNYFLVEIIFSYILKSPLVNDNDEKDEYKNNSNWKRVAN